MEERDRSKELFGCLLLFSRLIAVMAAGTGLIKGLLTGDSRMMVSGVVFACLFYAFVWLGVKLILKGIKKQDKGKGKPLL